MSVDPSILEQLRKAREPKPKKEKKPIKKISDKKRAAMNEEIKVAAMDRDFYLDIWHASAHKCQNCGCGLGSVPNNIFFHHVLFKSKRPDLRYVPENIMLLCLQCHDQIHRFPDKVPKILCRAEELEKQFPL